MNGGGGLQDNEVTHSGRIVGLLHECSYNTRQSRFHPLVSSGLCKSGFCAGLRLRANYILVSFDEYHPDKHYTWLPFPAAQCNPAVQQCNTQRGQRSAKLCSKEFKLTLEWEIKIIDYRREHLVEAPAGRTNAAWFYLASKSPSEKSLLITKSTEKVIFQLREPKSSLGFVIV